MAAVEVAWKSLWHEIYSWRCVVSMRMLQDDSRCAFHRTWDWYVAAWCYEHATCMVFSITKRRSLLWSVESSSEKTTFSDSCEFSCFFSLKNIEMNSLKLTNWQQMPTEKWMVFWKLVSLGAPRAENSGDGKTSSYHPTPFPDWLVDATHDVLRVSVVGEKRMKKKSPEIEGKIFPALSEKGFFQESWITRCSRNFAKPRNFFEIHAVLWDSDSSHMSLVFGLLPKVSCIWKPCWLVLKLLVNRFHVNTWPHGVFGTA